VNDEDVAFADVVTLQQLLTAKTLSSVELTQLYLDRLEKYGPVYNAVVSILHERALREARRADRERAGGRVRGPLHGIPYGVKDLLATPDAPTTWGAEPYRRQRFDYDATVVAKLSTAGAVLLAKLAMIELAGGFGYNDADASFTGPARSPWNPAYWAGGSSSGSGIAAAAGLAGFTIGTETAGSIVFPSMACGVTGLRPTFGRVSRYGAMALCWTLDKIGPIVRSARDGELVLRAIAGADPGDAAAVDRPFPAARRRPRIAVLKNATKGCMPAVARNFRAALAELATFCDDKLGGYVAYATPALDYIDAQRQRTLMVRTLHDVFGDFDAVAGPTIGTVTYPIGAPFDKTYTEFSGTPDLIAPGNLAGLPALALPNGFGDHGLPTSITLQGTAFNETRLTAIGKRYQTQTSFHRRRPPLVATVHA
jgi:aspartyl-tRNA(Asn)/glutamyl-tRNA(Gln) amidotransferase subunit A